MFCKKCGKEIEDNVVFCSYCGTRLIEEEKKEVEVNPDDGSAVAGFVLGILSIPLCMTIIIPILALSFSIKGKKSSKSGLATAGKVLSIISFVPAAALLGVSITTIGISIHNHITAKDTIIEQSVLPVDGYTSGQRDIYDWYRSIGTIQTFTADEPAATVRVNVFLGYKKDDVATATEITSRSVEVKEFLRRYFRGKTAAELKNANNEEKFQMEIRNGLNDKVFSGSKIRAIQFDELNVVDPN